MSAMSIRPTTVALPTALVVLALVAGLLMVSAPAGALTPRVANAPRPVPVAPGVPSVDRPWTCHGIDALGTPACGGAPPAAPVAAASFSGGWSAVAASPPPMAASDFEMTYDAADGYVLLIGAVSENYGLQGPTQTWTYAHGNWTLRHPGVSPENCPGSSLAYDDVDQYVVYLGGTNFGGAGYSCGSANQTWTYRAGVWTQLSPTSTPSGLFGASLTNDSKDGYLLLFGGESATCAAAGWCQESWKFVGGTWTLLSPTTSPSARGEAGLAYDVADGYVLLFGGTNSTGPQNDTWNFSGGQWTRLHPAASPPAPTPDAFSYDSADRQIVYTSAYNSSGTQPEITWTYSGGTWSKVTNAGPAQRLGAGTADDPTDGGLLFFGGTGLFSLDDSWMFRAGTWTNVTAVAPGPRSNAASAYDGATGSVVLFGGSGYTTCCTVPLNDTWTYRGSTWTRLALSSAPSPRSGASLVYDASDGYLLLFGGSGTAGALNDTWEFSGVWTQLTPVRSPSAAYTPAGSMVYDGADGYVLLFAGPPGHAWTWTFHAGVWTNVTSTAGTPPPGPSANPLVYDSTDGTVLLFGPTLGAALTNQTWTFLGGKWTNATSTAGSAPPASGGAAFVDFPPGGYVLLYEGSGGSDTFAFSAGAWSSLSVAPGPTPRSGTAAAYFPTATEDVLAGGISTGCGGFFVCDDTWLWSSGGPSVPYIRSFTAAPAVTDLGLSVTLTVSAAGGTGPLTYSYLGLPPGCTSANLSSLTCTATVAGAFSPEAVVTDSAGGTATALAGLTVHPSLVVLSLSATPASLTLGASTTLTAQVANGTLPYTYVYSGLPAGCSSQTVAVLPCTPSASGNFSVRVNVTDAVGGGASATVLLAVAPRGPTGGPLLYAFAAAPAALVLGNTTTLSATVAGGTAPYSYAYTNLPPGCTSGNASSLLCRPIVAGTFAIGLTVTDAAGASASVGTNVTVYPVGGGAGLTVSAFGPAAGTIELGNSTVLTLVASGGVGPLSYAYTGLPAGCAGANQSILTCRPTATGQYPLHAVASDSAGHTAGVNAFLAVVPAGAGPGPAVSGFVVSPANVPVGTPFTVVVSVAGGLLPLAFDYSGLPPGCTGANATVFACTPTASGNFTLHVTVTDALGRSVAASAPLEVVPATLGPTGPGGTPTSLLASPLVIAGLGLAGAAIALAGAAFLDRRRRLREGRRLVRELEHSEGDVPSGTEEV